MYIDPFIKLATCIMYTYYVYYINIYLYTDPFIELATSYSIALENNDTAECDRLLGIYYLYI